MTLEFHPLANLFPLIEGAEFDALVADVKAHGVREWIVIHEGMILDGRNRWRAAVAAKIYPADFDPFYRKNGEPGALKSGFNKLIPADGDPLAFVLSKNLARRHLNESQRAMVAARIATLRQGELAGMGIGPANIDQKKVTQGAASKVMTISERSVRAARVVQDTGSPELVRAVDRGQIAVSLAAQAAKLSPEQQLDVVAQAEAGRANAVRTVVKTAARAAKEKDLGAKQRALPDKTYGVILADPEWRFEPYSRETGMDRAPENHYPTTRTIDIMARPVASIAAKDCALFLWATAPMLPDAMAVMAGWGFAYATHFVWMKARKGAARGPGYWAHGEHEILLLGTRGHPPAPAPGTQWPSAIVADVGEHSEKPEAFHLLIEAYFPNLPKIELNARRAREGWDVWGFEAPVENEAPPSASNEAPADDSRGDAEPQSTGYLESTDNPGPRSTLAEKGAATPGESTDGLRQRRKAAASQVKGLARDALCDSTPPREPSTLFVGDRRVATKAAPKPRAEYAELPREQEVEE